MAGDVLRLVLVPAGGRTPPNKRMHATCALKRPSSPALEAMRPPDERLTTETAHSVSRFNTGRFRAKFEGKGKA